MTENALEFRNICKAFPGVNALDNISFNIKKGSVHAIVGENGAGKSTLINIISGANTNSSGELLLNGKPVKINSPHDARALGICTIYQELNVIPDLDVKNNMFIGREIIKGSFFIDQDAMRVRTKEILKALDIDIDSEEMVRNLSVAQCKMIEIGRALDQKASILIMDEPTASISDHEVSILLDFIKDLKDKGTTIIYISHKIEEIYKVCDHVTVLRDGKHIFTKEIKDVPMKDLVSAMINKEAFSNDYPIRQGKSSEEVLLEIRNLCYGTKVRNVSFSVKKGEIFGIAGKVGSGRTELAKAIIGELKSDSGEVFYKNIKIESKSPVKTVKKGIAYLPEDRKREGLFLEQPFFLNNIISNLKIVSRAWFTSVGKINEICKEYISKLDIAVAGKNQLVGTLSGGNQQKVVIAKWLLADPEILIFDEPTVGIDVGAKFEIRKLINQMADKGKSIIVISSEIDEVCNMSDRLIVLKDGSVAAELEKSQITRGRVYEYASGVK